MKILILGKFYPPVLGGIETHIRDLARLLGPRHEITLLVHNQGRETIEEQVDGVRLIRAGTLFTALNQPVSLETLSLVREIEHDVVHLHAPNAWAAFALLLSGSRRPLIVSHHADIIGREPIRSLVMIGYRHLVRRARALMVSQPNNLTCSHDLRGLEVSPVVIPYCVEPSPFADEPGFEDAARALKHDRFGDHPLAVFLGRLVPYKGADRMIQALASTPALRLVIVGDGPLRTEIEAQAKTLGVADRLFITGRSDERTKHMWLAASDFMILPSVTIAEAFGIVQVEAMLWGKPVLVTDLPSGVPQVGEPGVTSLVVPPDDPAALAEAMNWLVDNPEAGRRMGEAGRTRALDLYNETKFTQTYDDLYRRVGDAS
ncbi:MAG: glycosyltransferase [Brevundimonas sp.]|nr:MAG: glycosyltransferase [Brevundimonas sp.]